MGSGGLRGYGHVIWAFARIGKDSEVGNVLPMKVVGMQGREGPLRQWKDTG